MSNCISRTRYYELVLVRVDGDCIQGDDVILGATCIGQDITQMKELQFVEVLNVSRIICFIASPQSSPKNWCLIALETSVLALTIALCKSTLETNEVAPGIGCQEIKHCSDRDP